MTTPYTLNCSGQLVSLERPLVMGILNVTPDSFYAESRQQTDDDIARRAHQIVDEGGAIIDLGAYSSRPGADDVTTEEEMQRLRRGLTIVRREVPDAILSVDTFRADVAKMCVEEYGVHIVNDISGGMMDKRMFHTVSRLGVPYILMHMQGTPATMQAAPHYDNLLRDVCVYFAERVKSLHELGVNDVILDPGFGFGKTLEHNYELLAHLEELQAFDLPLLVGISRKSMIYRLIGGTPETSLNGTTVLNTIALAKGAHILRVHDVRAAAEAVSIVEAMNRQAHNS